ncbi:MAG TPA: P-II family nitrogen regulator [Patescibacteria group bacterium]|nr:P-II family nitrogen regulator [Patescibacteria group bacterium]
MMMIRAIVRPDKKEQVLEELSNAGYHAATMIDVVGRGKGKGLQIGGILYDEIPKSLILMAVEDADKDGAVDIVLRCARTSGTGAVGDGKIFISPIEEAYTVSSGAAGL